MENKETTDNAFIDYIQKALMDDPDIAQTILKEQGTPIKSYKIDFNKVTTLEELLQIMQHLNFVVSGPQEYFDEYCKGISKYLVQVEEGS